MRLGLFWQVFSLELRKQMSYRVDFWVNSLFAFVAAMGVMYYLWQSIYRSSGQQTIAGYTLGGMILYYLLVILLGRLVRGSQQVMNIAMDIYDGSLTRYQLYPTSYLGFKYAEHLGALLPVVAQIAIFALIAPLFLSLPPGVEVSVSHCLAALLVVVVANLLYFLLALPLQLVAFWADNVWSLVVMLHFIGALLGGAMLPLELFPADLVAVLRCTPFFYLYYFPVQVLLGQVDGAALGQGLLVMTLWLLVMGGLGGLVWQRGLRRYTGVGI